MVFRRSVHIGDKLELPCDGVVFHQRGSKLLLAYVLEHRDVAVGNAAYGVFHRLLLFGGEIALHNVGAFRHLQVAVRLCLFGAQLHVVYVHFPLRNKPVVVYDTLGYFLTSDDKLLPLGGKLLYLYLGQYVAGDGYLHHAQRRGLLQKLPFRPVHRRARHHSVVVAAYFRQGHQLERVGKLQHLFPLRFVHLTQPHQRGRRVAVPRGGVRQRLVGQIFFYLRIQL